MQTSLPDLPFTTYADAELKPCALHSSAYSTPRSYPRTDLQTLSPWTSFPNDIHKAIQSAIAHANLPVAPFDITYWPKRTFVNSEEKIRAHAMVALHVPVEEVMGILGVEGSFDNSVGGNSAIVGDPDFLWVTSPARPHPKLIVRRSLPLISSSLNPVCAFRPSIKLGGRQIWRIFLLPLMALVMTP
jgi:hypothetical protein